MVLDLDLTIWLSMLTYSLFNYNNFLLIITNVVLWIIENYPKNYFFQIIIPLIYVYI